MPTTDLDAVRVMALRLFGGADGTRTRDPLIDSQALSTN